MLLLNSLNALETGDFIYAVFVRDPHTTISTEKTVMSADLNIQQQTGGLSRQIQQYSISKFKLSKQIHFNIMKLHTGMRTPSI